MTQANNQPVVPGVAVTGGALNDDQDASAPSTDDGVPVGAADAQADAVRSGAAADDDTLADPGRRPDAAEDAPATDDGVPVGASDAEADRRRTAGDEA